MFSVKKSTNETKKTWTWARREKKWSKIILKRNFKFSHSRDDDDDEGKKAKQHKKKINFLFFYEKKCSLSCLVIIFYLFFDSSLLLLLLSFGFMFFRCCTYYIVWLKFRWLLLPFENKEKSTKNVFNNNQELREQETQFQFLFSWEKIQNKKKIQLQSSSTRLIMKRIY